MKKELWYNKEACRWDEALPIGNGRLGCMCFGGTKIDTININEETMWTGCPDKNPKKHNMAQINEIRDLVKKELYEQAYKKTTEMMFGTYTAAYQPYGSLSVSLECQGFREIPNLKIDDYHRSLDLENGITSCKYNHNGTAVVKEYFVSLKDDVFVMKISTNNLVGIQVSQMVIPENSIKSQDGLVKVLGKCPEKTILSGTDRIIEYSDEESIHFCSLLAAKTDGKKAVGGNVINIDASKETVLIFSLKTSFNGYDKMPVSEGKDYEKECAQILNSACEYSYEELKSRHIKEYKKYFDRVYFEIYGEDFSNIPTDERIKNAAQGIVDNGLTTLLFDYARYLTISSSLPGTQPSNLQGIWNNNAIPLWQSNYTININTQMNYWPTETVNLPECHMPLFKMLKDFASKGNNLGLRGWAAWHNTDIWRYNNEASENAMYGFWPNGGLWLSRHIWEHYLHTRDKAFLEEYYPVLIGATQFLEDWLYENDEGYLTTCPSISPENRFLHNGQKCAVCEGSAMDLSIIYDVFDKTIKPGEVLGKDTTHLKTIINKIAPVKIGKDGRILEWGKEFEESEKGHRHISHLYGFFPSDIWADKNLEDAVSESLRVRMENGGGHTGWSNAWITNMYARLKNSEKFMFHLRNMFANSIYPNMLDAHTPFQIDGNFGICSAICEAVMQSHTGKVELIPAIPKEWGSGIVKGFITRTGEKISFKWENGVAEIID